MGCKRQASAAAPTLTFVCVEIGSGDMLQVLPSGAMGQMALEVVELHLSVILFVVQSQMGRLIASAMELNTKMVPNFSS